MCVYAANPLLGPSSRCRGKKFQNLQKKIIQKHTYLLPLLPDVCVCVGGGGVGVEEKSLKFAKNKHQKHIYFLPPSPFSQVGGG